MGDNIVTITIPDYPDKIQIAKARRPVFYVKPNSKVKGRITIPKTYYNKEKYKFDSDGVLINKATGLPQLANPRTAGKPRYWVVNFQDIWNGALTKQDRGSKVDKLKSILQPYISGIDRIETFPVEISIILYDTACPVDISNRGAIYTKVIEDMLVKSGKIPNDTVEYVNCSGRIKFVKVEENKRMEIRIDKSDNQPF